MKDAADHSGVAAYTTLPRKKRSTLQQRDLAQAHLERTLATLNISSTEPPIPPPRVRRTQRKLSTSQSSTTTDTAAADETRTTWSKLEEFKLRRQTSQGDYSTSCEVAAPSSLSKKDLNYNSYGEQTCDIIQSSQQTDGYAQFRRPDVLPPSAHVCQRSRLQRARSDHSDVGSSSRRQLVFYKPRVQSSKSLDASVAAPPVGTVLMSSPEGSFDNPAFMMADGQASAQRHEPRILGGGSKPTKLRSRLSEKIKPVALPSPTVYSTLGSTLTAKASESPIPSPVPPPSPPSSRFRRPNHSRPSHISKDTCTNRAPTAPTIMKPILSAKNLETSLKQYSLQSVVPRTGVDTNEMCSASALENMMKYYNMADDGREVQRLDKSKKLASPYSSSSSLNVCGDTVDVVMRRKKKVKIRPASFSSDDESVKRVSLEINFPSASDPAAGADSDNEDDANADVFSYPVERKKTIGSSETSLTQAVEKLELDDLTSTETAKYLKKQFSKLKSKATHLRMKDNEIKQKFAQLQSRRLRLNSHSRPRSGRMSPTIV